MKKVLFLFLGFVLLSGCSSSPQKRVAESPVSQKSDIKPKYRLKSRVEIKNEDGTSSPVKVPGSTKIYRTDPKTGKRYLSDGWIDPKKYGKVDGKHLRSLSNEQIISRLGSASAHETTLIIEELKSRRLRGVKPLVSILSDNREAVFPKGREYWWYQKKDSEPEPVPLGIYAAFTLQFMTGQSPSQVIINLKSDGLFYAVRGEHAVVKEDVVKVWLKWWEDAKNDY